MARRTLVAPEARISAGTGQEILVGTPEIEPSAYEAYAPTPLNARATKINGDTLYFMEALDYIQTVVEKAKETHDYRPQVVELLQGVTMGALFRRIEKNEQKSIPLDCSDEMAAIFSSACLGLASPAELLQLISEHPTLSSLELAKLTRVGDWDATKEMDEVIAKEIEKLSDGREHTRSTSLDLGASVLERKDGEDFFVTSFVRRAELFRTPLAHGRELVIVQRDVLALDLVHPGCSSFHNELTDWLETAPTGKGGELVPCTNLEVIAFVDNELDEATQEHSGAVIPAVRSYYAFVSSDETSA